MRLMETLLIINSEISGVIFMNSKIPVRFLKPVKKQMTPAFKVLFTSKTGFMLQALISLPMRMVKTWFMFLTGMGGC